MGSNATQPSWSNHTSGHAWAFLPSTVNDPLAATPGVKPTATRAGTSSERAIAANVPANCSQYPMRWRRKASIAELPCPWGISRLYSKLVRNQSWRATIAS